MLGEGVRAALEHCGIGHRTVCYVEREASAAAQLVALMEEGALDQAPIWSDLLTFDGAAWRGSVDCVVAGFPCQDISVAGRRVGLDGKRSGLFFNVVDIATACGAWLLILENVSGIVSATASVVDEEDGELLERAASRVVGELADRGWHAEWTHIRASDVGGSHQRERWFCVSWRPDALGHAGHDAGRTEFRKQSKGAACGPRQSSEIRSEVADAVRDDGRDDGRPDRRGRGVLEAGHELGDTRLRPEQLQQRSIRPEHPRASGELADACRAGRQQVAGGIQAHANGEVGPDRRGSGDDLIVASQGASMGDPARVDGDERPGFGERAAAGAGRESRAQGSGIAMGHSDSTRPQGWCDDARERRGEWPVGAAGVDELFAPGPLDQRWSGIVANRPDLAPAVEPGVRMLADGMAYLVDESRNHQLRQIGNGVVPLQAATALVLLLQRAGLRVDRGE
ncbi:DNA cytosine methyltransferase [Burkholderia cepacia]|uniref:DNA cytosine methyltransferase n=1 Tax=Burkholderia cepacia TaxID=292 RepID=UPI001F1E543C|nr:DNA cytosine methyltransferase [Burkholderia cepacia]MCE4125778.1 DNA cytosine methyltransferase [Burkholderia cepacia]